MTAEDNHNERSNMRLMVVFGICLWFLVKAITFVTRHDIGGPDLAKEDQLQTLPLIVTVYEENEADRNPGITKADSLEATFPDPKRVDNESKPNPAPLNTVDEPNRSSPDVVDKPETELPASGPDVPQSLTRPQSLIDYGFEPGKELVYAFDIRGELGSQKFTYQGRNTIQATGNRVTVSATEDQVSESTGTGFVVHPDGIVATCAHVVVGATKIVALVDGTESIATVIELDEVNDLALLRLEKGSFSYLKFARSDKVRLGQEARAIGYPLTDVLGETIKVTRGEVSGRGGPAGTDGIQIDATINPGNSGGPLVDNSGRVIGVTSSLLAGAGISQVGFAVPSNRMIAIAKQAGVSVEVIEESSMMSTPEVIDLVRPATVLLKITTGPQGVGVDPPHELKFSGYCYASNSSSSGRFRPASHHDEFFNGTIQVNRSGQLLADRSDARLPFGLGKASLVGIEPLPRSVLARSISQSLIVIPNWKTEQDNFTTNPYGLGSFASRRQPPWVRSTAPPLKKMKAIVGTESITLALGQRSTEGIDVMKTYSVQFEGDVDEEPPLAITGSGKGKFDPNEGRMLSMKYEMTISVNQDNLTVRIPIAMNYKLLTTAELDAQRRARKERDEARAKAKAAQSAAMGFRSADRSGTQSTEKISYQKVKDAPETRKLNKFNPDQ